MRSFTRVLLGLTAGVLYVGSLIAALICIITIVGIIGLPACVATFALGGIIHLLLLIEEHIHDQLAVQRAIAERTMLLVDAFNIDQAKG